MIAALLVAILCGLMVNPARAGTTTADFLKWERTAQVSYLQIAISMAGTVATQVRPEMATCLDDWYFKTSELQDKRHQEILEVMPQYTKYHPTAFLVGYIESACGRFDGS